MNRVKGMVVKARWWVTVGALSLAAGPIFVSPAFADNQPTNIQLTNPLGSNSSFGTVTTAVTSFLFLDVAVPLTVIMALVGAFQLMTSAGDPEKASKGRRTLLYAAIGFAIALIAGGLADLLKNLINGS